MKNIDKNINKIFDEWAFPFPVKDFDGWEVHPISEGICAYQRTVYLEVDENQPSQKGVFSCNVVGRTVYAMFSFDGNNDFLEMTIEQEDK